MSEQEMKPYLDHSLPIDVRVNDLVSRMTLDEKLSQLLHDAPAIERLHVPKYNWWSECLHGIGWLENVTVFPQAIGLAATWNDRLIHHENDIRQYQSILTLICGKSEVLYSKRLEPHFPLAG